MNSTGYFKFATCELMEDFQVNIGAEGLSDKDYGMNDEDDTRSDYRDLDEATLAKFIELATAQGGIHTREFSIVEAYCSSEWDSTPTHAKVDLSAYTGMANEAAEVFAKHPRINVVEFSFAGGVDQFLTDMGDESKTCAYFGGSPLQPFSLEDDCETRWRNTLVRCVRSSISGQVYVADVTLAKDSSDELWIDLVVDVKVGEPV